MEALTSQDRYPGKGQQRYTPMSGSAPRSATTRREGILMLLTLWIVNILLALAFLAAGLMKLIRNKDALVRLGMTFVVDTPIAGVKAIGAVEVLGALGLILPLATGIATVLTPVAATGLALVMIGAIIVHIRRHEKFPAPVVLMLLAIASAVLGFLTV